MQDRKHVRSELMELEQLCNDAKQARLSEQAHAAELQNTIESLQKQIGSLNAGRRAADADRAEAEEVQPLTQRRC